MGHRILSRDEIDALDPNATHFIYRNIIGQHCSPDVIEKTLLQAMVISRMCQRKVDEEGISFLFDRLCEHDDVFLSDADPGDMDPFSDFC